MNRPTSDYREYRPASGLESYLACTWSQVIGSADADFLQRVLPDGCADVVWIGDSRPRLVGPATTTVVERLPPGTRIVGVRVRPGAVAAVLDVPAFELRDAQVTLDALWGREALWLSERVDEAQTLAAKLAVIEATIRARIARRAREPDPMVLAIVASLEQHLQSPVAAIVEMTTGMSERQLRRRFHTAVGYGPKMFQRVARLRRLRQLALSPGGRRIPLSTLAYDLGYADQAHMTREVTTLAGISPALLLSHSPRIQAVSDPFAA
jgi:methylphosphotriester-DNA--protein-cysteine methyltransferase